MRRRNKNEEGRKKSSKRARGKGKARIAHTMEEKEIVRRFCCCEAYCWELEFIRCITGDRRFSVTFARPSSETEETVVLEIAAASIIILQPQT